MLRYRYREELLKNSFLFNKFYPLYELEENGLEETLNYNFQFFH